MLVNSPSTVFTRNNCEWRLFCECMYSRRFQCPPTLQNDPMSIVHICEWAHPFVSSGKRREEILSSILCVHNVYIVVNYGLIGHIASYIKISTHKADFELGTPYNQ